MCTGVWTWVCDEVPVLSETDLVLVGSAVTDRCRLAVSV